MVFISSFFPLSTTVFSQEFKQHSLKHSSRRGAGNEHSLHYGTNAVFSTTCLFLRRYAAVATKDTAHGKLFCFLLFKMKNQNNVHLELESWLWQSKTISLGYEMGEVSKFQSMILNYFCSIIFFFKYQILRTKIKCQISKMRRRIIFGNFC